MRNFLLTILLVIAIPAVAQNPYKETLPKETYSEIPVPVWSPGKFFSAEFSKPFWGIGDALHSARISFFSPHYQWGRVGGYMDHEGNTYFSIQKIAPIYQTKLFTYNKLNLSLWVSPTIHHGSHNETEFVDFDPSDPLFTESSSFLSLGFDMGSTVQLRTFSLYLWLDNLISPNLSIKPENAHPPKKFNFLLHSYLFSGLKVYAGSRYDATSGFIPDVGAGYEFSNMDISLGWRNSSMWFELSVPILITGFNIGYDLGYHVSNNDVSRAGLTSHRVGLIYAEPQIILPKPDLMVFSEGTEVLVPLEELVFNFQVVNKGEVPTDTITYLSFISISESETSFVGIHEIPILAAKETLFCPVRFYPKKPGSYKLFFSIDDDGSKFPKFAGNIEEEDETDNRLALEVEVYEEPFVEIAPIITDLMIPNLTYMTVELPIEPKIFFNPDSYEVPERFEKTLGIIAERMLENPEVILEVKGFVDPFSEEIDSNLAKKRAQVVADKLVRYGAPRTSVIAKPILEYDFSLQRIVGSRSLISNEDKKMIGEENRRVEISASIMDVDPLVYEFEMGLDETEIPKKAEEAFDTLAGIVAGLLCSNLNSGILLEGLAPIDTDPVKTLEKLNILRNYLIPKMQMFCPLERMPVSISIRKVETEKAILKIWVTPEEILFKPFEEAKFTIDFNIPEKFKNNIIEIRTSQDSLIDRYRIYISESGKMEPFIVLSEGKGAPPKEFSWKWIDNKGFIIDPRESYRVVVDVKDIYGKEYEFFSKDMVVFIDDWTRRTESSLLVRFTFDEAFSESKYLESRLEDLCGNIIAKSSIPNNQITVRITGHTDIIGSPSRNKELSIERTQRMYDMFKTIFKFTLNLTTDKEFEDWLAKNNVEIITEGKGEEMPFEIQTNKPFGEIERTIVGNNSIPEGRVLNRRVSITVEEFLKQE